MNKIYEMKYYFKVDRFMTSQQKTFNYCKVCAINDGSTQYDKRKYEIILNKIIYPCHKSAFRYNNSEGHIIITLLIISKVS